MSYLTAIFLIVLTSRAAYASPVGSEGGCSDDNVAIRREWGALSLDERTDYINAVLCMRDKPPVLPTERYPGVRNRMDDFTATHINYTLTIHFSGIFLAWHRHFVHLWEAALRDECGYRGYQPYWNWPLWASTLSTSPLFDGSMTSLSGNGVFSSFESDYPVANATIPRGTGGGCVLTGPFANMTLHLGPFSRLQTSFPADAFAYHPRCFTRSLNSPVATKYTNQTAVHALLAAVDIVDFQSQIDHGPSWKETFGVHGGGHYSVGQPMHDVYASPQDPSFMLHHAMIDRVWSLWQDRDEPARRTAVNGSRSLYYADDTPQVTMETELEFGVLDQNRRMGELMDPRGGGYCYGYT